MMGEIIGVLRMIEGEIFEGMRGSEATLAIFGRAIRGDHWHDGISICVG